jgi:hypothetical protein
MAASKIFSFDAETDGLWGNPWAIGAVVLENGEEIARFSARLDPTALTDGLVRDNLFPACESMLGTHSTYKGMLHDFATFYLKYKLDADVIAHMGYIAEAHLLREMHANGYLGDWDAPYPLYDLSGSLQAAGMDPTSADKALVELGLTAPVVDGGSHNPIYDSLVAGKVYYALRNL